MSDTRDTNDIIKKKAESLANKMNELTEKFNLSDELTTTGKDLEEVLSDKANIDLYEDPEIVVNLEVMLADFKYIRESLKETTDNGRKVLNSLTFDLLSNDEETRAGLITSFAELNRAVGDNMKLYMQSYKDITTVLLNLQKAKPKNTPDTVNNTLIISEPISTADLIKKLS